MIRIGKSRLEEIDAWSQFIEKRCRDDKAQACNEKECIVKTKPRPAPEPKKRASSRC